MTPTHKDLVEALREARRGLEEIIESCQESFVACSNCGDQEGLEGCWEEDLARSTLSKINPILERLEGKVTIDEIVARTDKELSQGAYTVISSPEQLDSFIDGLEE